MDPDSRYNLDCSIGFDDADSWNGPGLLDISDALEALDCSGELHRADSSLFT